MSVITPDSAAQAANGQAPLLARAWAALVAACTPTRYAGLADRDIDRVRRVLRRAGLHEFEGCYGTKPTGYSLAWDDAADRVIVTVHHGRLGRYQSALIHAGHSSEINNAGSDERRLFVTLPRR